MITEAPVLDPSESWDNLNFTGPQQSHWTTDNLGEAAPGVQSPLSASFWDGVGDAMPRKVAHRMGVYSRAELDPPSAEERVVNFFYGRFAMRVEYVASVGDRVPGTTGKQAVEGLFAKVPDSLTFKPTRRRYPVIAVKLPVAFALAPRRIRVLADETDAWWRERIPLLSEPDP